MYSSLVYDAARFQVRQALNQRYLLTRRIEKDGLRRSVFACLAYVAYGFVKQKFWSGNDSRSNES